MKLSEQTLALYVAALVASTRAFTPTVHHHGAKITHATQRPVTTPTALFGVMDEVNSGAFDLSELVKNAGGSSLEPDMSKAFEILLAELVFSSNDPVMDIIDKFDRCSDSRFLGWLTERVDTCTDVDEKGALRDLLGIIEDVISKNELALAAQAREDKEKADALEAVVVDAPVKAASNEEVLTRAKLINTAAMESEKEIIEEEKTSKTFLERDLTPEIRSTYEKLVAKLLPPYRTGESVETVTAKNYDKFDAQLMKVLTERAENGDGDSKAVMQALAMEQAARMMAATEKLKTILGMGDPMRMEGAIVKMCRNDEVDETLLLLLEANAVQAEQAGAIGAAELMRKLKNRADAEKDKNASSKEIKLLRQLLREDNPEKRQEILTDAFTPKESLIVPGTAENAARAVDGEAPEDEKPMPEVPPPDFINCCKAVMLNFGNVSDGKQDLSGKVKIIASEAEVVATRIYGQGMSSREQQDRAWKDSTRSIFDLETLEIEAERMGVTAPWANADAGDEILPGFDADGKMSIGGG
uniref:Uncharacterized protein n=1 Tax=Proboscia inermis TaxID=420281 RepID=A0A6T8J2K2_9STRA|mmetsp:Transcript_27519/g.27921  ORF Transcript_27519/g.27921 Transcript_27519/m.27921 type:complete len:528 (+) Transcript_27519:22-1605(+)|eukprot:CAMPEP_0171322604 /NCGR_PEP_ID=MMETSP0816-20121228/115065_1 /TAXON_ID=420281 /ORGANISM="Proboscia inermis, Strain CCAP1064/1" /LENGTH=527 /DNA_ID=CAMNT_0011821127 /DNA_START=11 /DNA_END=1594 /DNA_ORIENTATION=-